MFFSELGKFSAVVSSNKFPHHFLSSPLRGSTGMKVRPLGVLSWVAEALLFCFGIFFYLFFFLLIRLIICIELASGSLNLFSLISRLLLSPSSEFLILFIVFFSSKNSIWFFFLSSVSLPRISMCAFVYWELCHCRFFSTSCFTVLSDNSNP